MQKTIKKITVFIAKDGKEFRREQDCINHEQELDRIAAIKQEFDNFVIDFENNLEQTRKYIVSFHLLDRRFPINQNYSPFDAYIQLEKESVQGVFSIMKCYLFLTNEIKFPLQYYVNIGGIYKGDMIDCNVTKGIIEDFKKYATNFADYQAEYNELKQQGII